MNHRRILPVAALAGAGVWLVIASLFTILPLAERAWISSLLLPTFKLVSTSLCLWAAGKAQSFRLRLSWLLFATALALSTIGDAFWSLLELNQLVSPSLSPMDIFFLPAYALALAGVMLLPIYPLRLLEWIKLLSDTSIVILSAALVFWLFWWAPILASGIANGQDLVLAVAYPLSDLLLCWGALFKLFGPLAEQRRGPVALLTLSFFVQAGVDLSYGALLIDAGYSRGYWPDPGWLGVQLLVMLTCVSQAVLPPGSAEGSPATFQGLALLRLILPYSAIALSFGLLAFAYEAHSDNFLLIILAVGLIVSLSLLRQVIALWENARLARQLQAELRERQQAQMMLQRLNAELEQRVAERTRELLQVNEHLRQSEARLSHEALHDALTGLPNRSLFMDRLARALERARRYNGYGFAVLFLDLDGFKVVNDSLGHALGDRLLIGIAQRLTDGLRAADTVARLGGDEFVILLENVRETADAIAAAERVLQQLAHPFELDESRVFISASIGVVTSSLGHVRADDVLRDADIAMYHAKSLGKARYAVFDAHMHTRAVQRLSLESELRDAIERQEFYLNYQPILDLQRQRISGFEALLRWRHPVRGNVPPGDFIPVAEETGLIVPIGQWVLHEACRQLVEWQAHLGCDPLLTVSVNLSALQFKQANLAQQVADALAMTGLSAQCLKLEITESAIMEDAQSAIAMLNQLRALGVQVQIDDFGTGYSSLSYLHRFPVDTLKIDRSFIRRIGVDGDNMEIVRTIIALAHDLGMSVIAEGLETPEQLERLTRLACEQGQGYLISRPLDVEQVIPFIRGLDADLSLSPMLSHALQSA